MKPVIGITANYMLSLIHILVPDSIPGNAVTAGKFSNFHTQPPPGTV